MCDQFVEYRIEPNVDCRNATQLLYYPILTELRRHKNHSFTYSLYLLNYTACGVTLFYTPRFLCTTSRPTWKCFVADCTCTLSAQRRLLDTDNVNVDGPPKGDTLRYAMGTVRCFYYHVILCGGYGIFHPRKSPRTFPVPTCIGKVRQLSRHR